MEPFTVAPSVALQVPLQSAAEISRPKGYRRVLVVFLSSLIKLVALTLNLPNTAKATEPSHDKSDYRGPGAGAHSGSSAAVGQLVLVRQTLNRYARGSD